MPKTRTELTAKLDDIEARVLHQLRTAPIMAHRMIGERRSNVEARQHIA